MRRLSFFLLILIVLCGCQQETALPGITPLATPMLQNPEQWAIVTEPYVSLRSESRLEADVIRVLRRADVLNIMGISTELDDIEGAPDYWYLIKIKEDTGWVHGSYLRFYPNKAQAVNAAQRL